MSDQVQAFLCHRTIREALQDENVIETLSEIVALSEFYIPTLEFLMRPDNLRILLECLLEVPTKPAEPPVPHDAPTYMEYAVVYRAHWILCGSGFSSQLISALVALQGPERMVIAEMLARCDVRDTMVLEALSRFLNAFMDQYSPDTLLTFLGSDKEAPFAETLLVLIYYEPIRDVLLRVLNETADSRPWVPPLASQVLYQLAPDRAQVFVDAKQDVIERMVHDEPHQQFSRMIFTCDLLTDLIHEHRSGSVGYRIVQDIMTKPELAKQLIDAAAQDLHELPSAFANESYAVKVLNSMLQQSQCGCVARSIFGSITPDINDSTSAEHNNNGSSDQMPVEYPLGGNAHDELPSVWKTFIDHLPRFLEVLKFPKTQHFKTTHVQMVYLMLPVLNVSCAQVDHHLIEHQAMDTLLDLVVRFPESSILHCAVSRLFIVALEDSPFMFGKELPAFRASNDPLRLHLLKGCFQQVLKVFERMRKEGKQELARKHAPPPVFLDVAISFDQAVSNAQAHSPHLFSAEILEEWHSFRMEVLIPTQAQWEEQYEAAAAAVQSASPVKSSISPEMYEQAELMMAAVKAADEALRPANTVESPTPADLESGQGLAEPPKKPEEASSTTGPIAEDVPTPLSALYNDEEKQMMLKVSDVGKTPEVAVGDHGPEAS